MMTSNIKTQLFDLVGSAKNSKTSQSQKSSESDFANIMDSSVKSKDAGQEAANKKSPNVGEGKTPTKDTFAKVQQEVIKDSGLKAIGATEGKNLLGEETEDISFSNVENLIAALQDTIQNQLGISEEELEKAMETLGLTMLDLLNPDNLKQVLLQVKGTDDVSEFLTNEDLSDTLKQLTEAVNNTAEEFPITKEQVKQFLDEMKSQENPEEFPEVSVPFESADTQKHFVEKHDVSKDNSQVTTENAAKTTVEVVKTYTEGQSAASDNTSDGKEKETQMATSLESFIQNLATKGNEGAGFAEEVAKIRQMQDITDQITTQIKVFIKPEQTSMEIQLNPEHLGRINLSVVAKDGILTAQFQTQNELTKEAIESQLHILRENLNNQGLKVEAIEVTVSNFNFAGSDQAASDTAKQQNQPGNRGRFFEGPETVEDEKVEASSLGILEQATNSVDYTA